MTGLVLEGGAMRGMFTAGVLDVLMIHGIRFDGAVGVSAGAVFGCNYKSGQIGRVIRYNKRYCSDPRYVSLRNLLQTGDLYGEDFCYRRLPEELDPFDAAAYAANPMPFWAVCTDVRTGQPVYHLCATGDREDIRWMQASASMPIVSRPVCIGEELMSDGGTADSIPLRFLEGQGFRRNVVVLTRPAGYVKRPVAHNRALNMALHAYPALAEALRNRPAMYNETLSYVRAQEEAGAALVLRPPEPLAVGAMERHPERLEQVYQQGRQVAEACLADIQAFIAAE